MIIPVRKEAMDEVLAERVGCVYSDVTITVPDIYP
jgi:hypothetical protein